jgi:hypothetical protein
MVGSQARFKDEPGGAKIIPGWVVVRVRDRYRETYGYAPVAARFVLDGRVHTGGQAGTVLADDLGVTPETPPVHELVGENRQPTAA